MINFIVIYGQENPTILKQDNLKIKAISEKVDSAGWVFLKEEMSINPDDIFTLYKEAFGLKRYDEMRKVKMKVCDSYDKEDVFYHKYQQFHKGIPVENYQYIIHEIRNVARVCSGNILENISANNEPSITEKQALEIAIDSFNSSSWEWLNYGKDTSDTLKPVGKLIFIRNPTSDSPNAVLVYKFKLRSIEPSFYYAIYVNAQDGKIEKKRSLSKESTGTVYTLYNGTQSLTTKDRGFPNNDYILKDETRGYICTKDYSYNSTTWILHGHIDDDDNIWSDLGEVVDGATAQWVAEKTYDYYKYRHGRNGIDGNNQDIRIKLINGDNSRWEEGGSGYDYIELGEEGANRHASLDIVGHEFTHGVTYSEVSLAYEKEPGALDESFADIFGTMVEKYVEGSSFDWTIAEDIFDGLDFFRSMENPNSRNHPDEYEGVYWYETEGCSPSENNDFCGVHTNCGVQNYWFYLLSKGGTANGITITAIGEDKAARIAYRNLKYHLSSLSDYNDSRNGSVIAAEYIYGECSIEHQQTMNAWAAVGIGEPAPNPCIPQEPLSAYISGPEVIIDCGSWSANVSGGTPPYYYNWYLNNDWKSSNSSYIECFDNSGFYEIYLTVTDGYDTEDDLLFLTVQGGGMLKSFSQITKYDQITIQAYPNPSSSNTTIKFKSSKLNIEKIARTDDLWIYITNNQGYVIFNDRYTDQNYNFDTSRFSEGIYYISLLKGNKCIGSTQLIIKH
ncbi:MAG: M4 family metallopeptidase [Kosmotogaceae bacterium]